MGFPGGTSGKEPACQRKRQKRHSFDPWVGKIPWRGAWQPTLVFLPRESHRQRSLVVQSMKSQGVWHDWAHTHAHILYYEMYNMKWTNLITLKYTHDWTLCMRWPKYFEFQLQHQSFQWTPRTPLGWTGWISLQSKGLSRDGQGSLACCDSWGREESDR